MNIFIAKEIRKERLSNLPKVTQLITGKARTDNSGISLGKLPLHTRVCVCVVDQNQGLTHDSQVLYHDATSPAQLLNILNNIFPNDKNLNKF